MSQSKVIPEIERAKYTRNPPDGKIEHVLNVVKFRREVMSHAVEIGGLNWKLEAAKRSLDDKEFLYVSLIPQRFMSAPWSIELTAEYIIEKIDPEKNVSQMHHYVLLDLNDLTKQGCYLIPWDEMMDEKNEFIDDDEVIVDIHLTIIHGLRCNPVSDFTSSGDIRSDVVLMIEGKPVHVNKQYLSLYSPVFQTMFFGDSPEKGKNKIKLEDVDYVSFIDLMHVIYPCQELIADFSAEGLIELADRFQIPSVIHRAEDVLIYSERYSEMEKIRIADKYKLYRLLNAALGSFSSHWDFRIYCKRNPIYEGLSDATKIALLEALLMRDRDDDDDDDD